VAGSCEHGNTPSGSIKGGEFLDGIGEYKLLDVPAPWSKLGFYMGDGKTFVFSKF
jgi:hypothetical protein